MVGGLLVSQLLTLFITPVFYTYMEQFRGLRKRSRRKLHVPVEAPGEAALKG
jgi:HAE1 family hydrophobic/amphiphilic exporter-1